MADEEKKAVTVVYKWDLAQKKAEAELAQTKAQLDQQQLLANQDLAKLKAQFDLFTGLLPKGETKPLEGKVTADEKSGYLAEMTGYAALDRVAGEVAKAVVAKVNPSAPAAGGEEGGEEVAKAGVDKIDQNARIVIVDSPDFASGGVPLLDLQMRLDWFKDRLSRQNTENQDLLPTEVRPLGALTALVVLGAIPGVLSAASDVLGFFKTNTTLAGQDFAIPQSALQMAVVSKLVGSGKQLSVYLPGLYTLTNSAIISEFKEAHDTVLELRISRERLQKEVVEVQEADILSATKSIAALEAKLKELGKDGSQAEKEQIYGEIAAEQARISAANGILKPAATAVTKSDTLLAAWDAYAEAVTKKPDDGSPPALVSAALREKVQSLLNATEDPKDPNGYLLYLTIHSAGGESINDENIFKVPNLAYLGGLVAGFALATSDGAVLAAGTLPALNRYDVDLRENDDKKGPKLIPLSDSSNNAKPA